MKKSRLSVFGLGYVGLCTVAAFSDRGYHTVGVDVNEKNLNMMKKGEIHFYEHGLESILKNTLKNGTLTLTNNYRHAIEKSDISFITVGTPSQKNGKINLRYVKNVSKGIGKELQKKAGYHLVVVKSTVVPGTTKKVVKPIIEEYSGKACGPDFGLCVNPEFLREGNAIDDVFHPDRIIIGSYDDRSGELLENFYKEFYRGAAMPVLRANLQNAELIKYSNNAFLATKISFINTIANICEKIEGADVNIVAKGVGLDYRISPHFLRAGLGYGGSCFPKDVKALINFGEELSYHSKLLESVEEVNQLQPLKTIEIMKKHLGPLKNKKIAILGLSFKPGTDDMRNAVSLIIIKKLLEQQSIISVYDPKAIQNAKNIYGNQIIYTSSISECIRKSDCCIIATEWDEFKNLTPEMLIENMNQPFLIDGRRITDPEKFKNIIIYEAIGLGPIK